MPASQCCLSCLVLDWHHKFGHLSNKTLAHMLRVNNIRVYPKLLNFFHCTACGIHKSQKLPFSFNSMTSSKPLELIYSDVWSTSETSVDCFKYYVLFVDHYTKYIWLYPLRNKSDVFQIFLQFKPLVEKFFGFKIISVFSDNGDEYRKLIPVFNSMGISHYTSPLRTPEHNWFAERRHRHIVQTGLSLLHFSSMPIKYWSYAFQTTVYLINRMPTPIINNLSHFQKLFAKAPNYDKLQPFGCLCFPWLKPYTSTKLQPKSASCVFLGYSQN